MFVERIVFSVLVRNAHYILIIRDFHTNVI